MKIRKLDGLHDWTFGAGKQNYAVDEIAVEENIQTRVLSWQGDCFFALQEGIDWRNLLDKNQQENIELAVAEMILRSYGVIGINMLQSVLDDTSRNLSLSYSINTIYGQLFTGVISQGV